MILITISIESVTTITRILFRLHSTDIVNQLHIPRTYRSYPGVILIILFFINNNIWLFIVGGALVLSDLLHRLFTIPFTSIYGFKLAKTHFEFFYIYLRKFIGVILLLIGIFALVTPLTPGAWLGVVGLIFLVGKEKTVKIFKRILGEKYFNKFHIQKYISKLPLD